jgi:SAM-dependent methyltransferase
VSAPWPDGFFDRQDDRDDAAFYADPRFVTHLDDPAITAVSALYAELGTSGDVLDLMSSWVSHLPARPRSLTVLGLNADELAANPMADTAVVQDLNASPGLPFPDSSFDAVLNCVSVDYLVRPVEVYAEVARVLRPGGVSVCTFSNRCFPSKAVRGWLLTDDAQHCALVAEYHRQAGGFDEPVAEQRLDGRRSDPLWAVWARRSGRRKTAGVDGVPDDRRCCGQEM